MKKPIKPEDIKRGDLIRYESHDGDDYAVEFRAYKDGHSQRDRDESGQHYLLDRPTPPVELPTEALSWGTLVADRVQYEGVFQRQGDVILHIGSGHHREPQIPVRDVTAWEPHVAVPKAALDELREYMNAWTGASRRDSPAKGRIDRFLAAVDAANQ